MHTHSAAKNKIKSNLIIISLLSFTALLGWFYYQYSGNAGSIIFAVVLGAIYALVSYFSASKIALKVNRAKPISKQDYPKIYKIVEELTSQAKIPMPSLYIVQDSAANAFATGRSPKKAHVAVTSGILERLNDDELKAVLAHEISHVKNYDIRLMMVVFACVTSLNILIDFVMRSFIFGDDNRGGSILPYLLMSFISPIIGLLVQAAVSRQREYAADLSGAEITHKPQDLASALLKISQTGSALKKQSSATAHLFFANPLKNAKLSRLFATHPPVEDRIKLLNSL
jgi:heat shock protein HtpX